MKKTLLLDTDVIIDYLRNFKPSVNYIEKLTNPLSISAITVAELYAGIRDKHEQNVIEKFLHAFQIVPLDNEIAQLGGSFRKTYGKSHGTGLVDALIAATALQKNADLITLNIRHYPMLKAIKPYDKLS